MLCRGSKSGGSWDCSHLGVFQDLVGHSGGVPSIRSWLFSTAWCWSTVSFLKPVGVHHVSIQFCLVLHAGDSWISVIIKVI